jgi:hypothetical protein
MGRPSIFKGAKFAFFDGFRTKYLQAQNKKDSKEEVKKLYKEIERKYFSGWGWDLPIRENADPIAEPHDVSYDFKGLTAEEVERRKGMIKDLHAVSSCPLLN